MAARRWSSIKKCPRNRTERNRCFTNWVIVFLIVITIYCIITNYFWHWEELDAASEALAKRRDEFLTTSLFSIVDNRSDSNQRITVSLKNENNALKLWYREFSKLRNNSVYSVITSDLDVYHKLMVAYSTVKLGGYYQPANCSAKTKIAIIVPYRGPEKNIGIFLGNIHNFMIAQKLEYQIFIIQPAHRRRFNKGRLFNAGFQEVRKFNNFSCIIFHEMNLLPSNLDIKYSCSTQPQVLSTSFVASELEMENLGDRCSSNPDSRCQSQESEQRTDIVFFYNTTLFPFKRAQFDGVVSMTVEMFLNVDGFPNKLRCQDSEMLWRLNAAGYRVDRLDEAIGVFKVLPHNVSTSHYRFCSKRAVTRDKKDGISNLKYVLKMLAERQLYTHIVVKLYRREKLKFNTLIKL